MMQDHWPVHLLLKFSSARDAARHRCRRPLATEAADFNRLLGNFVQAPSLRLCIILRYCFNNERFLPSPKNFILGTSASQPFSLPLCFPLPMVPVALLANLAQAPNLRLCMNSSVSLRDWHGSLGVLHLALSSPPIRMSVAYFPLCRFWSRRRD